ncbi:MAG: LysM peptidoglycan-binding domain-containing protein [Flavobacteriales bacterium]|nr:LysM peptidoglycan-binding domain-containing protein [Flavobacteriales bacterium]
MNLITTYTWVVRLFFATSCLMLNFIFSYAQQTEIIGGRKFYVHKVQPKETVYGISKQYGVSQDTIFYYNKSAISGIKIDQILKFPVPVNEKTNSNGEQKESKLITLKEHAVQEGETLYGISRKYGITVEDIITHNPQVKSGLKAGEVIRIPIAKTEDKNIGHQVQTSKEEPKKPLISEPNKEITQNKQEFVTIKKSNDCKEFQTEKKSFRIAFLLPFTSGGKTNTKIAAEFFGGARVALDSLKNLGLQLEIFVYDTRSKNDSDQVDNILSKPELKTMDMIIGPLYSANIGPVAEFASLHKIPVVSPFSRSDQLIHHRPYLIKITPDEASVARRTIKFFTTFYPNANYILVDPGTKKDSLMHLHYYQAIKNIAGKDTARFHFTRLKSGGALGAIRKDVKNVIIFPCSREITVKDYLTKINKAIEKADISFVGTDEWLEFNNIEADYYENLNLHIPTVNYANYTDSANTSFIIKYQQLMKTDPDMYAFKGYYVTFQMVSMLAKYGEKTCECLHEKIEPPLQPVHYRFQKENDQDGWENQSIQMLIFRNYRYVMQNY